MPNFFSKRHSETITQTEELHEQRFKKETLFSKYYMVRITLLKYTSIQPYKMLLEDFPLPYLSLSSKISKGKIDAIKCSKAFKKDGKMSDDICLLFVEKYL